MENEEIENKPKNTHASKSKLQAHIRRRKLVDAVLTGKPLRDVAIETGLSPKTAVSQACQILKHPKTQQTFIQILEQSGLSDKFLADKLHSLINAKVKQYAQKDGIFTDEREQPAWETQRKTVELVCRLAGHLQPKEEGNTGSSLMQIVVNVVQQQLSPNPQE